MRSQEAVRTLCDRVLALSRADEAVVHVYGGATTHLRFARNAPSTSGHFEDTGLTVTSSFGRRSGQATGNRLDDDSLRALVRRSEALARLVPEDPEFVPALGPQRFAAVDAFDSDTARAPGERLAAGVADCIREAREEQLLAAGYTQAEAGFQAIASSPGLFGHYASTAAYASETVRTRDGSGSGWASATSGRLDRIDYAALSATATGKAKRSAKPRTLAPGRYPTVLEPACVANLVQRLLWRMSARDADEGRSWFSAPGGGNRIGESIFPGSIQLRSDPADPRAPGAPFLHDGLPQHPRDWIRDGRLMNLVTDRGWAAKREVAPVPYPSNLIMAGGDGSVADLVRGTKRGLLVTSLWYIRDLDPRTLLVTGLTRDGVFWIEDGEIAYPVANLRWNESPIAVLRAVEAMSRPVQVAPRPSRDTSMVVPALRVSGFHFTSASDAI